MAQADIVEVELFVWMKSIIAKNNGKKYYMIGKVKANPPTLLVTLAGGNGGAMMFCQTHEEVYPIKGKCSECQNAPRITVPDASVTSCDTPKIER